MHERQYELDEFHAENRREAEADHDESFWRRIGTDLLRAGLLAAVGVVVRELIRRIEGRDSRHYDPYSGY